MIVVAMIKTRAVVATASAWAKSPLASPSEPMVWKRAITAVVPITTSPERRQKHDQGNPADRVAHDRKDQAECQNEDKKMPESHRSHYPLELSIFDRKVCSGGGRFPQIFGS